MVAVAAAAVAALGTILKAQPLAVPSQEASTENSLLKPSPEPVHLRLRGECCPRFPIVSTESPHWRCTQTARDGIPWLVTRNSM